MSRTAVDGDRRAVAGGWHALIAIVHIDRRTIRAGRGRRTPAARGLPVAGNEGDRNDDTSHGHCRGGGSAAGHRNRADRKSVVEGKGVSVRVDTGGRRIPKKKNK